jgi:hypothetical protein
MLSRWFTEHPRAIGESYVEHQRHALHFSGALFRASLACFIHALLPAAFEHTASRSVVRLYGEMSRRAARETPAVSAGREKAGLADCDHGITSRVK